MNSVFADTFYYLALLSGGDAYHERAVAASKSLKGTVVTTSWVLTEIADGLATTKNRLAFGALREQLLADPQVIIIPPTQELFDKGVTLYLSHLDKGWSLTDCISFVVMRERGIYEALTGDHHFQQAGFRPLLS
jgi:hypothetical protein